MEFIVVPLFSSGYCMQIPPAITAICLQPKRTHAYLLFKALATHKHVMH